VITVEFFITLHKLGLLVIVLTALIDEWALSRFIGDVLMWTVAIILCAAALEALGRIKKNRL